MIIRNKNIKTKKSESSKQSGVFKGNVIKKEDLILDNENIQNTNEKKEPVLPSKMPENSVSELEEFEKIDITSIEFKERAERRRGDRRRGYRRIDERSLVSRAQAEAHSIKELAAKEGYKEGLKKAQKEIDEIKSALVEFLSIKDEMYNDFYPHILEISMEVAKKIIKKEVEMSDDILKNTVLSALEEVNSDAEKIQIKVNPNDEEFAEASLPDLISAKKINAKVTITQDSTVEAGSCVIIANNGVIDANFSTQLSILQAAFGIYKGGL